MHVTPDDDLTRRGIRAKPALRCAPFILAAVVASCGSSGPESDHSIKGAQAVAHKFFADAEAQRYEAACGLLTASARRELAADPEHCTGILLRAKLFLLKTIATTLRSIGREGKVVGNTLVVGGDIVARYEDGRWRFENALW
jgi:hypothetical protein